MGPRPIAGMIDGEESISRFRGLRQFVETKLTLKDFRRRNGGNAEQISVSLRRDNLFGGYHQQVRIAWLELLYLPKMIRSTPIRDGDEVEPPPGRRIQRLSHRAWGWGSAADRAGDALAMPGVYMQIATIPAGSGFDYGLPRGNLPGLRKH